MNTHAQIVLTTAAALLAGCTSAPLTRQVNEATRGATEIVTRDMPKPLDGIAVRGSPAHVETLARAQKDWPVMRVATGPWIGSRMVPVNSEDNLPQAFREQFDLKFAEGAARVPLEQVASRLTSLTGVPVRIQPDVYRPTSSGNAAGAAPVTQHAALTRPVAPLPAGAPIPLPVNGGDSTLTGQSRSMPAAAEPISFTHAPEIALDAVDMRWKGTLQGFLNHVTDRLGLAWEFRDNTVVIMRFVTEYHEITAFPGATDFSMSSGGSATGGNQGQGTSQNSTADLNVTEKGKLDAIATIEKAVMQMVKSVPGSEVIRSDGSGRLVVKTTKEMQAQVRDFIRAENAAMLRQVQVQFDIYSVRTNDADERGFDWNLVFRTLSNSYNLAINAPATLAGATSGGATINILNAAAAGSPSNLNRRFGDSTAILNLLREAGVSAQYRPVSLLALNRQWARKAKLNTEGYLSETTPGTATANGVGIPGLKTDKVTTGDTYVAMPLILDNNTVMLKFGVNLSDLLGLFDVTSGSGNNLQKVQVPRVSAISDQYTVALKTGEVMAITGLSRLVNTSDSRALGDDVPVLLGGSRRVSSVREHYLVLVRPVLL